MRLDQKSQAIMNEWMNNNTCTNDNVYGAVTMADQAIARVHPVHLMNAEQGTSGRKSTYRPM